MLRWGHRGSRFQYDWCPLRKRTRPCENLPHSDRTLNPATNPAPSERTAYADSTDLLPSLPGPPRHPLSAAPSRHFFWWWRCWRCSRPARQGGVSEGRLLVFGAAPVGVPGALRHVERSSPEGLTRFQGWAGLGWKGGTNLLFKMCQSLHSAKVIQ